MKKKKIFYPPNLVLLPNSTSTDLFQELPS